MLTVRSSQQVGLTTNFPPKKIVIAKLQGDTTEDIPSVNGIPGLVLFQGTTFWDISTGKFYAMTSDAQWHEQGEE